MIIPDGVICIENQKKLNVLKVLNGFLLYQATSIPVKTEQFLMFGHQTGSNFNTNFQPESIFQHKYIKTRVVR